MIIEKYGNNLKKNQKQKLKAEAEQAKKAKLVKEIPGKKKPGVKEQIQSATVKKKSQSTNVAVFPNKGKPEDLNLTNQKKR